MSATTAPGPSDAELRAQLAREHAQRAKLALDKLVEQRRKAALRHSRERSVNIVRAAVAGVVLAAILGIGMYRGWLPEAIRNSAPPRNDPLDNFSETRTGQIVISPPRGDKCRQFYFNNETGYLSDSRQVECNDAILKDTAASPGLANPNDRLGSIRNSFIKK
jgi:hypothetical protein